MTDADRDGLRRLACPFCDYSTQVAARLGAHLERDHPEEVVVPAGDRVGTSDYLALHAPASWQCLECGFVFVPEDRHAPTAGRGPVGTTTATVGDQRGRPFACPRCDELEADRPTGVDLFVAVESD